MNPILKCKRNHCSSNNQKYLGNERIVLDLSFKVRTVLDLSFKKQTGAMQSTVHEMIRISEITELFWISTDENRSVQMFSSVITELLWAGSRSEGPGRLRDHKATDHRVTESNHRASRPRMAGPSEGH